MIARRLQQKTILRTLVVLLGVFLLAQTLGWMHRGLHAFKVPPVPLRAEAGVAQAAAPLEASAQAQAPVPRQGHAHRHAARPAGLGWLEGLFAAHDKPSDCQLLDAITQAGCLHAAMPVPMLLPMASVFARAQDDFVARWAALFDARGPPLLRS